MSITSPPPPPIGTRLRLRLLIPPCRFSRCSGEGAKLAHAAASRNFSLGFFSLQTRACQHTRCIEKIPFPSRRAPRLPLPCPSIPKIPPPRPPTAPLDDLRRCAWGRFCPTTPGVTLLVLFCGASEIKKIFPTHDISPSPAKLVNQECVLGRVASLGRVSRWVASLGRVAGSRCWVASLGCWVAGSSGGVAGLRGVAWRRVASRRRAIILLFPRRMNLPRPSSCSLSPATLVR